MKSGGIVQRKFFQELIDSVDGDVFENINYFDSYLCLSLSACSLFF